MMHKEEIFSYSTKTVSDDVPGFQGILEYLKNFLVKFCTVLKEKIHPISSQNCQEDFLVC